MSHEGKMRRGEKWYSLRDRDGNLPKEISEDPNKMIDVDYFLDISKTKEEVKEEVKKKKGE